MLTNCNLLAALVLGKTVFCLPQIKETCATVCASPFLLVSSTFEESVLSKKIFAIEFIKVNSVTCRLSLRRQFSL